MQILIAAGCILLFYFFDTLPFAIRATIIIIGICFVIDYIRKQINKKRNEDDIKREEYKKMMETIKDIKIDMMEEYHSRNFPESEIKEFSDEVYNKVVLQYGVAYHSVSDRNAYLYTWSKFAIQHLDENVGKYTIDKKELEKIYEEVKEFVKE